jgi:hypothetical protein
MADTTDKQHLILELRSGIYESMRKNMLEILDITVPRSEIARFVEGVHAIEKGQVCGSRPLAMLPTAMFTQIS